MSMVMERWNGAESGNDFEALSLQQQGVWLLKMFGGVEAWNLGVHVGPMTYRQRAYGVFVFLTSLVQLHPEISSMSQIRANHHAEVTEYWEKEGMPEDAMKETRKVMSWMYDCLTDPEMNPY